jgi:hypothetical protein
MPFGQRCRPGERKTQEDRKVGRILEISGAAVQLAAARSARLFAVLKPQIPSDLPTFLFVLSLGSDVA